MPVKAIGISIMYYSYDKLLTGQNKSCSAANTRFVKKVVHSHTHTISNKEFAQGTQMWKT